MNNLTKPKGKVWARILNGRVIEYPITERDLKEEDRDNPQVVLVTFKDNTSEVDKFHKKTYTMRVVSGKPYVYTNIVYKSNEEFVNEFYLEPLKPYFDLPYLRADSIPEDILSSMVVAIRDLGTMHLDRFAQEKGYDNILSLVSYRDDVNPVFAAEARRGIEVRSSYWTEFNKFYAGVLSGAEFPRTVDGITKLFPNLKWS